MRISRQRLAFITAQATSPAGTCPCHMWPDTTVPTTPDSGDTTAVELGVKFTTSISGYMTASGSTRVRRTPARTRERCGAHRDQVGDRNLHQRVDRGLGAAQLHHTCGGHGGPRMSRRTTTPDGHYSILRRLEAAVTNGPLTALASSTTGQRGLPVRAGRLPDQSYNSTNYWVDVVFSPHDSAGHKRRADQRADKRAANVGFDVHLQRAGAVGVDRVLARRFSRQRHTREPDLQRVEQHGDIHADFGAIQRHDIHRHGLAATDNKR